MNRIEYAPATDLSRRTEPTVYKAITLDFYNTLAHFTPTREERQAEAARQHGHQVDPAAVKLAYVVGERYWTQENALSPIHLRPEAERVAFYAGYEQRLMRASGLELTLEQAAKVFDTYRNMPGDLMLYDDVLPALDRLAARGLVLGVISNADQDVAPICERLGLVPYLDFILTSALVGAEKPHPAIFEAALSAAATAPTRTIHIGDQYYSDVVGARAVGMRALLLDRHDYLAVDHPDAERIGDLWAILPLLDAARGD